MCGLPQMARARLSPDAVRCLADVEAIRLSASGRRATFQQHRGKPHGGIWLMAIHLTPTELAREANMDRREVIEKCMELGVPIFQGRIDKTLFMANLSDQTTDARQVAAV
jgi:hypothetical protein